MAQLVNLKAFRKANKIKQEVLADYLGVSRGYISIVETTDSKLSDEKVAMLLANDKSWDTSMLIQSETSPNISVNASGNGMASVSIKKTSVSVHENIVLQGQVEKLKKEVELLTAQLQEEKERSNQYWELIQRLTGNKLI